VVGLSGSGVQAVPHVVTLSWTPDTSAVAGYQVYSGQVSGGPYSKVTGSAVNLASYTDGSVQSGKTYYYVVTAVDSNGVESSYSNQATAAIP
jgi:fibronectin type 3 domain-containing protein